MLLVALVILAIWTRAVAMVSTDTVSKKLWHIYTQVAPSEQVRRLRTVRTKLNAVRTERSNVSSKDEFARWARLDREHQKLKKELEGLNAAVGGSRLKLSSLVRVLRWLLTTGVKLFVLYKFSRTPVIWLPPRVLPYPVEWMLSLPRAPLGSISASVWLTICDHAWEAVAGLIIAVAQFRTALPREAKPDVRADAREKATTN